MLCHYCFLCFAFSVPLAATTQQHVAFDVASTSSTYSSGNLAGSPAFAAQQALSGGSGYWCSSGGHSAGQSVTWTGLLYSRRVALGVKVDWAYSPGEVKVLTSSDGANFEEAKCWHPSTRSEAAFKEVFMFDAPRHVKAVTIAMRTPQSWSYFGINSAALITEPGPLMLVSGITSAAGEQCLIADASEINLAPCLEAIATGTGKEVMQFDQDGQLVSMMDGSCLTLLNGDAAGGGVLAMQECGASASSGDGRTSFVVAPNGQLKLPRMGNYCVTFLGGGGFDTNVAQDADTSATSSDASQPVGNLVDGDAQSYWASGSDPTNPVDVQLDLSTTSQIKSIEIEWEHPAQAFELQVSSRGKWTSIFGTTGNNARTTKYVGPAVSGNALRIRMSKPHPTLGSSGGKALYSIRDVRILASTLRSVVQDCAEAEQNADARDVFFEVAVPEFDPRGAAAARQSVALLRAAEERLGNLLAELYVTMPSLAACGFKQSFDKRLPALAKYAAAFSGGVAEDAASIAVAAVSPSMGMNTAALQELVEAAQDALKQISR